MFNKEPQKRVGGMVKMEAGETETVIGQTVKVDGDFVSEGNVLVQGVVNGSLKTKGNLHIEKGAKIKANVEAANAVVRGEIKGNVTITDNLELGNSASIEGDIITKVLSIEPGAILNGHCSVSMAERGRDVSTEPAIIQKPAAERGRS